MACARASRARGAHAARGRRRRAVRAAADLRSSPRRGLARGIRAARQRHRARADDRPHAADVPRLLRRFLRHPPLRRHSRPALSAGAALAARGSPAPAIRDPRELPGRAARDGPRGARCRTAAARLDAHAEEHRVRRRPLRRDAGRAALAGQGAGHRPAPVHVRQHGQPEGRDPQSREPPRQHPRDGSRHRRARNRRVRELAAALPRHGPDRRVARHAVPRRSPRRDVADGLPGAARELAARAAPLSRHTRRRTELRLRDLRDAARRCPARGTRSVVVAHRVQRCGAGGAGDARTFRRAFRALRVRPARARAGVRPRRIRSRAHVSPARPRPVDRSRRPHAARRRRRGGAGTARGHECAERRLLRVPAAGTRDPHRRSGRPRAARSATRAASSSAAPR